MNYQKIEQRSPEWWQIKVGKVSGTRFGQLISSRENSLYEELVNELLDGYCEQSEYESEDMIFGTENESVAIDAYEQMTGLKFARGGVILSDFSSLHMASPDGIIEKDGIVLEIKCTQHGKTQIKRFLNGIDTAYRAQIINYFATSDDIKEVHWVSFCPFRPERPIISIIITRDTIIYPHKDASKSKSVRDVVTEGRQLLKDLEQEVKAIKRAFETIEF